jgi:LITAF-like zinc ribbon domain
MIEFPCPNCRTNLSMPDAAAGKDTECMTCGRKTAVPWPPGREPLTSEQERPSRRGGRRRPVDDYDHRRGFRCPHCRSTSRPLLRNQMSETGLILLICLLVAFFPLFWIGFLMREDVKYCADCGAKLGRY